MSAARNVLASLRLEDGRRWIDAAAEFQLADALAVLEGRRPYHFLTRARGASKTTDLAAVALALLLSADDARRSYWLGADADQGTLALDSIAGFVARTPALASRVELQSRRVLAIDSAASLDVLAADAAGAWGLRPFAVFADELAQWADTPAPRRLWEAVSSAVAKLPDARLVVLTTAGDPAHFAARVLDHAHGSPLWRVNEVPGPAPWSDPDRLAEQRARLTESAYARLFENRWAEGEDRLTTVDAVRECVAHEAPLDHDGRFKYVIGVDIGLKRDRTAAIVAHKEGAAIPTVAPASPERRFAAAELPPPGPPDSAPGRVVVDRIECWQGSRLRPVKLDAVESWIQHAVRSYGRARVILDPWQSIGMAQRLRGRGVDVEEYSFSAQSVGRIAATLYGLLRDRALALPDDEALLDELAHVRLRETAPGAFRLDHDPGRHDDRAVALALAASALLREPQHAPAAAGPSIWGAAAGIPLERWKPEHVDPGHPDYADHHLYAASNGCTPCRELALRLSPDLRRALAGEPPPGPPQPQRRGRFLIHQPRGGSR